MKKENAPPSLSSRQKKHLRGLGHHLDRCVIVGRDGLTDNVVQSCEDSLQAHELVKIKLGRNCPLDKQQAAETVAARTGSHPVQLIGRTILLYRANPDLPPERAIQLPR